MKFGQREEVVLPALLAIPSLRMDRLGGTFWRSSGQAIFYNQIMKKWGQVFILDSKQEKRGGRQKARLPKGKDARRRGSKEAGRQLLG
jgi:hypothetical protein